MNPIFKLQNGVNLVMCFVAFTAIISFAAAGPVPSSDPDVQACGGGSTEGCQKLATRMTTQCPTDVAQANCNNAAVIALQVKQALDRQSQVCGAGEGPDCNLARATKIRITNQFQSFFDSSGGSPGSGGPF
jgi:hypothetical protein